jgi:3-deoxy-D-manno-octulosonic-acid transferase
MTVLCCHVTENVAFVSVFHINNIKNKRSQSYHSEQSTVIFLSSEGSSASACTARETQLVNFLDSLTINSRNGDRLPCGLECTEKERQQVSTMVTNLVSKSNSDDNNKASNVKIGDILGEWNLLYTSSRTMMINKSLSGLGRSESDKAKVASIRQKLSGTK